MAAITFAPPEMLKEGYATEAPVGVELLDTAGSPIEICKFSLAPGASTIDEAHEEHEVWFITGGSGQLTLDGEIIELVEGAAIEFKPHAWHQLVNTGNRSLNVITFYWGAKT